MRVGIDIDGVIAQHDIPIIQYLRDRYDIVIHDGIDKEDKDIVVETSMAKFWTTEMVRRISDKCIDLYGDMAIMDSVPTVRYWKDARAMSIFAGTNEIMRKIVAKFMKI